MGWYTEFGLVSGLLVIILDIVSLLVQIAAQTTVNEIGIKVSYHCAGTFGISLEFVYRRVFNLIVIYILFKPNIFYYFNSIFGTQTPPSGHRTGRLV